MVLGVVIRCGEVWMAWYDAVRLGNNAERKRTPMNELFNLADKLRALREEKDTQTAILKDVNSEIDAVEYKLSEAMALSECQNFTRNGRQFILTTTTRWSPETERKEELYDALKQNGHSYLFTVNPQTLGSFIREQVSETTDDNGDTHVPEWLLGLVKSYDIVGITMKSAAKKSK